MTCKRAVATIFLVFALPSAALAQAGTITKGMQNNCANDYKKFCGDYGLQTAALNLCMKKAGPSLSPACVQALVQAGKVSQADVDKIKAQMKGASLPSGCLQPDPHAPADDPPRLRTRNFDHEEISLLERVRGPGAHERRRFRR